MTSTARKIEPKLVFQEFGEVLSASEGDLVVRTAFADVRARRAASCLIAPGEGDRVLVVTEEGGESFVLAVLVTREPRGASMEVDGDVTLRSRAGKVSIAAEGGIDLVSGAPITVASPKVEVHAVEASFVAQALSVVGGAVKAELDRVKVLSSTVDVVLDRLGIKAKRATREVDGLDQVKARHLDYAAAGNAHLRGENTIVTAEDLVKVNGEQVHIG